MKYLTEYLTKNMIENVRKFQKTAITSQYLNYLTWCFVRKFLLDFSTTYIITSQQTHTPYISLKKDQKKGIYTECEEINCEEIPLHRKDEKRPSMLRGKKLEHWILIALLRLSPYGENSRLWTWIVLKLCTLRGITE